MKEINQLIKDLELPFVMDVRTIGRGNCFFHAVLQQIERHELHLDDYQGYDHHKLRTKVCEFAINSDNDTVKTMAVNYDSLHGTGSWVHFFG